VNQTSNGAWSLTPGSDLTAAQLRAAIEEMDASKDFKRGPETKIRNAIFELISVTSRPQTIDDAKEIAYQEALCKALLEYPTDVVILACQNWRRIPSAGRWWPSEQDLRVQCDLLVKPRQDLRDEAESLLRYMERRETAEGSRSQSSRLPYPNGKTEKFFNEVMKGFGPAFCKSWLSHRTCEFSEDTIYTIGLAVDRLTQNCSGLLKQHGVKLERCEEVTKRFYADEDAKAPAAPPKRRKP